MEICTTRGQRIEAYEEAARLLDELTCRCPRGDCDHDRTPAFDRNRDRHRLTELLRSLGVIE